MNRPIDLRVFYDLRALYMSLPGPAQPAVELLYTMACIHVSL